jgi:hypothetical protein
MKQYIITGLSFLWLLSACGGMNDNIQEYLDRGEINYVGRPDSARTFGGNGRINIQWTVNDDPRIENATVFWTDKQNKLQSADFAIDRNRLQNGYMSVVMNLDESSYAFKIVHTGTKGYASIATEVTGNVYGENYQATIAPRRIAKAVAFKDRVELTWAAAEKEVSRITITFRNSSGSEQTIEISPEETLTSLPDYEPLSRYSWTTYYLPEEGALDEFSVTAENTFPVAEYPLDKTEWTVTCNINGGTNNTVIENVIDGNLGTVWFKDAPETTPIRLTIDMKGVKFVKSIEATQRYDVREVSLEGSLNGNDWTDLGIIAYTGGEKQPGTLTLPETVTAQYLRITVTRSSNSDGRGGFWEINVIGSD